MLEQVINAVRRAAHEEVVPRYLNVARAHKADGSIFTEADLAAQESLVNALTAIADYPVLGEEMTLEEQESLWRGHGEGIWVVDPIDGTSNFVSGLPYFAVSVALMRGGKTQLAVVYSPVDEEMFYAEAGMGAFLNGERLPIKTHVPASLKQAMAGIDFKRLPPAMALRLVSQQPYSSQRNYGASTLDWCYTAAGRFDVYLHGGQKLWDYAAGSLILQEAGGHLCTLDEDDFWAAPLWKRSVIAGLNGGLFTEWRNWLRQSAEC